MVQKTKIRILGGGFGGLYTARELEKRLGKEPDVEITLKFSGFVAWWLWRTIYLSKLPRLEKKLRVTLDSTLDLVFSKDLVQFTPLRSPNVRAAERNFQPRDLPTARPPTVEL